MSGNGQYILSILGVDGRDELLYKKEGFKDVKARHFQKALRKWYPDAYAFVLATEEAETAFGQAVKEMLGNQGEIIAIPDGRNIEEFYEIYNTIAQEIPSGARVIFDITHGYRSLPVLALLTLSYLREAKEVEVTEILYAAKQGRMGIVVDLAPFLGMLDWAAATNRYIDIVDARHLAQVMRATAGLGAFGGMDADLINKLADELEGLSNALLSNNPFAAGRQAKALLSTLEEAERALGQQESGEAEHPIRLLLDRLQEQLKRMAFDHKSDDDATVLAALFNIMAWYYKHHYTEKAAALAKE
ncbi:TIGR02221 family CRISPR-associated protein, partial [Oceanithermus sp.]